MSMDPELRRLINEDVARKKDRLFAERGFLVFITPRESISGGKGNFGAADEAFKILVSNGLPSGLRFSLNTLPYDGSGPIDLRLPDAGVYWLFSWARADASAAGETDATASIAAKAKSIFSACSIVVEDRTADLERILLFV